MLVQQVQVSYQVGERRACRVLAVPRMTVRYRSVANPRTELRVRMRDLASSRPCYGFRRLHVLLCREGWGVNHKLVDRLYCEDGQGIRRKTPRRRRACRIHHDQPAPDRIGHTWSMDFMADQLFHGQRFRLLT